MCSYCEDAEYESETHVLTGAVNFRPVKKLNLTLSATYTDSDAGMDRLSDYSELCATLAGMDAYSYDLHTVHTYSDLDITQTELTLQAVYQLDKHFSLGCGGSFLRYDDASPYLFDGSGKAYLANFSVMYFP